MKRVLIVAGAALIASGVCRAATPPATDPALAGLGLDQAKPIDESYQAEFTNCDNTGHFRNQKPAGYSACNKLDKSNVTLLARLPNGGIVWTSKMALDIDGSVAAAKEKGQNSSDTRMHWPALKPSGPQPALDADQIPFAVIPNFASNQYEKKLGTRLADEFEEKTGLAMGDLGIVVYHGMWTPAIIGDTGDFNWLGEASAKVFQQLGEDRCKRWSADGKHCTGIPNSKHAFVDDSVPEGVTFIFFPHTARWDMNAANAVQMMCAWAKGEPLKKTGSPICAKYGD